MEICLPEVREGWQRREYPKKSRPTTLLCSFKSLQGIQYSVLRQFQVLGIKDFYNFQVYWYLQEPITSILPKKLLRILVSHCAPWQNLRDLQKARNLLFVTITRMFTSLIVMVLYYTVPVHLFLGLLATISSVHTCTIISDFFIFYFNFYFNIDFSFCNENPCYNITFAKLMTYVVLQLCEKRSHVCWHQRRSL